MVFSEAFNERDFLLLKKLRILWKDCLFETSHPLWLVKRWVDQFGFEETRVMCELNLTAPMMTARVNTTKTNREECLKF